MQTLPALLLSAAMATSSLSQWELVTPTKTRSEFQGIRMVHGVLGQAIDH
ncbi:MAG: hypothetical protein JNL52_15070 [Flavobacteriales bacterium]|nr:hypothetical protein [Flavobacteriales bacterium]